MREVVEEEDVADQGGSKLVMNTRVVTKAHENKDFPKQIRGGQTTTTTSSYLLDVRKKDVNI